VANKEGGRAVERGRGDGGLIQVAGSPFWYMLWRAHGKQFRKSTGETGKQAAKEALRKKLDEVRSQGGQAPMADPTKITYEILRKGYLDHFQIKKMRSLKTRKTEGGFNGKEGDNFVCGLDHLDKFFEGRKIGQIVEGQVTAYVKYLQDEGLGNAAINRSLAILRRMFNIAKDDRLIPVTMIPNIKARMLEEPPPRGGFIRHAEFLRLVDKNNPKALPPYLRAVVVTAYHTGMRKGELLKLEWANIDLAEGLIRLRAEQTKNKKTRLIPLNEETIDILKSLKKQNAFAPVDSLVFLNRRGKRILDASFNKVWNSACARLKIKQSTEQGDVVSHWEVDGTYVGLIPHDLRRSYVRSIDNSGVPQAVGQRITGHLDASVYANYNQKHREDLQHAVQQREAYLASGKA
jgi:integrase